MFNEKAKWGHSSVPKAAIDHLPRIATHFVMEYHAFNMGQIATTYQYLSRKPSSLYRQLFIKDRWIVARTLYGMSLSEDAMTPEEIAADYNLPLEAVLEAIAYCQSNPPEIAEDFAAEEAIMEASGMNDPNYKYHPQPRILSAEEMSRLNRL